MCRTAAGGHGRERLSHGACASRGAASWEAATPARQARAFAAQAAGDVLAQRANSEAALAQRTGL